MPKSNGTYEHSRWRGRVAAITTVIVLAAGMLAPRPAAAAEGKKSPGVAFALSLLLPGLGEYYGGGNRWWTAGFLTTEAVTWIQFARWRSKGNDVKADFRAYADQNWDEVRLLFRRWANLVRRQLDSVTELPSLPADHGGGEDA